MIRLVGACTASVVQVPPAAKSEIRLGATTWLKSEFVPLVSEQSHHLFPVVYHKDIYRSVACQRWNKMFAQNQEIKALI